MALLESDSVAQAFWEQTVVGDSHPPSQQAPLTNALRRRNVLELSHCNGGMAESFGEMAESFGEMAESFGEMKELV